MTPMKHRIKTAEDIAWLLEHTHAFSGGQVTDLHIRKQRLFDESTGREISAGTVLAAVIRYELAMKGVTELYALTRVAKLTMYGATDFSIFEQEGTNCSEIGTIHAEVAGGRLRFWFDPHGELYVICDEAVLEEVSMPGSGRPQRTGMTEWTFQAPAGELPGVNWFLEKLDRHRFPCVWRGGARQPSHHGLRWEGRLVPTSAAQQAGGDGHPPSAGVLVQAYGPLDGCAFVISLRAAHPQDSGTSRLLLVLTDLIARSFTGMCLIGGQIMEGEEWLGGHGIEGRELAQGVSQDSVPQNQIQDKMGKMQPAE
jgi:hypothetical protein